MTDGLHDRGLAFNLATLNRRRALLLLGGRPGHGDRLRHGFLANHSASVRNMTQTSLSTDNVFSDGWDSQLATVTGNVSSGYTATLAVPV